MANRCPSKEQNPNLFWSDFELPPTSVWQVFYFFYFYIFLLSAFTTSSPCPLLPEGWSVLCLQVGDISEAGLTTQDELLLPSFSLATLTIEQLWAGEALYPLCWEQHVQQYMTCKHTWNLLTPEHSNGCTPPRVVTCLSKPMYFLSWFFFPQCAHIHQQLSRFPSEARTHTIWGWNYFLVSAVLKWLFIEPISHSTENE